MTLGHEFRIETERLILRPRREGDREANWLWMQDDEVMRYLPRQPRAEADERFDKQVALQAAQDHCFWVVERKADGKAIGFCGIVVVLDVGQRSKQSARGRGQALDFEVAWVVPGDFDPLRMPGRHCELLDNPLLLPFSNLHPLTSGRVIEKRLKPIPIFNAR